MNLLAAHLGAGVLAGVVAALERARVHPAAIVAVARASLVLALVSAVAPSLGGTDWAPPLPGAVPEAGRQVVAAVSAVAPEALGAVSVGDLLAALAVVGAVRWTVAAATVAGAVSACGPARRMGRLTLRVGDAGPFALATPWGACIVLDRATWDRPADRQLALRHEVLHLRHGDALWAWPVSLAFALLFANPAAAWLSRRLRLLEELAVDRALLDAGVAPVPYADLLVRTAMRPAALVPSLAQHPVAERIAMMRLSPSLRRLPLALVLLLAALPLSVTALAVDPSLPEGTPAFVAERAEVILGSERGRAWVARGLANYEAQGPMVRAALAEAGLPGWLAAVPLIESAYENLDASRNPVGAAGMWQFMPETARRMGLVVDEAVDERLDPARATSAAVRLLAELHAEFGDWGLALAAYNVGAAEVRAAITKGGTRDATALMRAGDLPPYAADVAAAAGWVRGR